MCDSIRSILCIYLLTIKLNFDTVIIDITELLL
jgi:hypothetical protein